MVFGRRGFDINRPHGSIYYGVGDSALNASPFSLTGQPIEKPGYLQNSFGGSVGGPLNIPHIYHGGTQDFLFHQLQRQARGESFRSVFDGADSAGAARKLFRRLHTLLAERRAAGTDFQSRTNAAVRQYARFRKSIRWRRDCCNIFLCRTCRGFPELSLRDFREQRQRRSERSREPHLRRSARGSAPRRWPQRSA